VPAESKLMKSTKRKFVRCILTVALVGIYCLTTDAGLAAQFYVDFSAGSDSNTGTSPSTAWKHCPGDPSATGLAVSAVPAPGDSICFKGGVV
jgi:hypothetical protein